MLRKIGTIGNKRIKARGCGTVGRAVASDTRRPGFESSQRQLLLNNYLFTVNCLLKRQKYRKIGRDLPIFKYHSCAVVVALLAEQLLLTPENTGSITSLAIVIVLFIAL